MAQTATALRMVVHIEICCARLEALKDRPAREVRAERRLRAKLAALLAPALAEIPDEVPGDVLRQRALLERLEGLEVELAEAIAPEALAEAERGRRRIERAVAQARKQAEPGGSLEGVVATVARRTLRSLTARLLGGFEEGAEVGGLVDSVLTGELGRVARSILRSSEETAAYETERELGVREHRWMTAGDDAVREEHAAMHGEVVGVGELFSSGLRYPGEVGCRCWLEPVV